MNDFPIVYRGSTFLVDPAYFAIYSIKFREIFNPAFADFSQVTLTGNFQPKSVDIFCSLCQGKEVSIPDSCMKDIASLATLFNAEEILESATIFMIWNFCLNNLITRNSFCINFDKFLIILNENFE